MVFQWRLSDNNSPQVSRTLLSILAVFNNAVVWMVSTRPPTSKSSRPFNNPLVTVPKAPITIGIIVTFMFHSFLNSLARSRYLSFFSHSVVCQDNKVDNFADFLFFSFFFFLLIIIRYGLRAEIRWSVCISKSHRNLCVSFSRTGAGLCIYHLLAWSNFKFLAHFPVDHLADPAVSSFIFLLCQFAAFAYYVIDGFISVTRIVCICYFVEFYLSSLWYDWFLWRCFVLPFGEILFLS